jgi:hypothetical protein
VSGYSDGRKLEYATQASLEADGYWTIRAPASKGKADVVALKPGLVNEILFVQCKLDGGMGPAERFDLLKLATEFDAIALCARWVKEGRAARMVEFRQLTGPGPRDWQPWTANHALKAL